MMDLRLTSCVVANPGTEEAVPSMKVQIPIIGSASWRGKAYCLFNHASHFSCVAAEQLKFLRSTEQIEVAEYRTSRLTGYTECLTVL
jgi:hypothetical protein